jgi:hypothetical protein
MALNFFKIAKGLGLKGQASVPTSPTNGDVYYDSTANKFKVYENGVWENMVEGSSTLVNYVANPGAETDLGGWTTYANTAQSTPVTGTGGSPTVSLIRYTSSPLRGAADFQMSKGSSNLQGNGVSYDFSIASADTSKRLGISFDWKTSANYVAGDMGVYIYDVTNSVLIYPSVVNLPSTSTTVTQVQVFFNASTSTSYRLILHVATVNALSYTVDFDNVSVGPSSAVTTVPVTDWKAYTPTISGFGGCTGVSFYSRRFGDTLQVRGYFTAGICSGAAQVTLGYDGTNANVTTDSTKVTTGALVGKFAEGDNSSTYFGESVLAVAGGNYVTVGRQTATTSELTASSSFNSSQNYSCFFEVPISSFSGSSTNLSNSVVEYVSNSSTSTTASDTTSFAYGPAGNQIQSIGNALDRRVRFVNPIQPTDVLRVEVSAEGIVWFALPASPGGLIEGWRYNGTFNFGIGLLLVSGSKTDVDVNFGDYRSGTNTNWTGAASWYWRVVKSSNPLSIGQITTPTSMARIDTPTGMGISGTKIRTWTSGNSVVVGSDIVYTSDATNGDYWTIKRTGVYFINYTDANNTSGKWVGISVNAGSLTTTNIDALTTANRLVMVITIGADPNTVSTCVRLNVGDTIRAHTQGQVNNTTALCQFTITQVAI